MVKTTVEKLSPTRVKLNITVTPEELKPSITHAYEHIAESVNIPGFRKGKVPPPIIDQRVGREEVLNHAVSDGLDKFYREAVDETEKSASLGRPEADVVEWPERQGLLGRPAVHRRGRRAPRVRPARSTTASKLDGRPGRRSPPTRSRTSSTNLRTRFGTLVTVDRPAKTGDFAQLDLVADDRRRRGRHGRQGISYELGSGELIDGIDEALDTLTRRRDHHVRVDAARWRPRGRDRPDRGHRARPSRSASCPRPTTTSPRSPASSTPSASCKADLQEQLGKSKEFGQGAQARDKIVDELLEAGRDPRPAEAHRRRGAPSPREREPPRGRRRTAPRSPSRSEKTFRIADPARRDRREGGGQGRARTS